MAEVKLSSEAPSMAPPGSTRHVQAVPMLALRSVDTDGEGGLGNLDERVVDGSRHAGHRHAGPGG